ncbi:NAD(P)/FAD-dependent oxidoreductase [Saccharopolyspora shandongensis]|uniref:NAD(P)/FAD-dependent oxidoreductase n=1 Tax=Saccharopolyspora shandongensis TaxID=418495 RepID=UPI00340E15C1
MIMGGGPAGSTLGALLAKTTDLRIAILEREHFPREHIGESFAHLLIPILEQSGALPKVLASDCWVKKYGGIFNWDPDKPDVAFFEHFSWLDDGVHRWAMHVNRSEFDHILLDHAASLGVDVFQGARVHDMNSDERGCDVTLTSGTTLRCGYFVDSSGRRNSIATKEKRAWLSQYRNIAIWQHYTGCDSAQHLDYDWNIFKKDNLSPVGCFAFEHGWCWFIPVPKVIDGRRTLTHSIGIVTSPELLKDEGINLTDPDTFLRVVRDVPLLRELVRNAQPVSDKMHTATNYSMINREFANYDDRWMLVGDSAYFVDPLFSSGVGFACAHASGAALLLKTTFDPTIPESQKRDLWRDYDKGWRAMAETYSLSIDQWYHAISKRNPDSIYWRTRGNEIDLNLRQDTFQALLSTGMSLGLLQILTHGTRKLQDLDRSGPFMQASQLALPDEPLADDVVRLKDDVRVEESVTIDVPGFKGLIPPPPFESPDEFQARIAHYWEDVIDRGPAVPWPHEAPEQCYRFRSVPTDRTSEPVTVVGKDEASRVWKALSQAGTTYGKFADGASHAELTLFKQLHQANMVEVISK